jgi:hypothetical protein
MKVSNFAAKKQCFDRKSWGSSWDDGHYFYLSRFAKIGTFHVCASVLLPQGFFQPIYTILQQDGVESMNTTNM